MNMVITAPEDRSIDRQEAERKLQICTHIAVAIKSRRMTQVAAAQLLGIDQAKVSRITRGQFHGVSETKLLALLAKLGREVKIQVGPLQDEEAAIQLTFD
jgi:predicted XRE-type DNA-binding protein